jgi:hypothetical protein
MLVDETGTPQNMANMFVEQHGPTNKLNQIRTEHEHFK